MDAAAQAASEAAAAAALPVAPVAAPAAPTVPAEHASAPHEFQSRRASLKRVAPTRAPPSPSPSPEPEPEPTSVQGLRPSASSSSLEDQIAAGRRNLRKSPPPSPSPAHNTRKSVESYLAARWRAAATEPDPPLEDEAACPLDGGDLGPRLEAFESESIASSTDARPPPPRRAAAVVAVEGARRQRRDATGGTANRRRLLRRRRTLVLRRGIGRAGRGPRRPGRRPDAPRGVGGRACRAPRGARADASGRRRDATRCRRRVEGVGGVVNWRVINSMNS